MKKTAYMTLMLLALAVAAQAADRTVDQTRPLAADGRVEISNISGEVKVRSRNTEVTRRSAPSASAMS